MFHWVSKRWNLLNWTNLISLIDGERERDPSILGEKKMSLALQKKRETTFYSVHDLYKWKECWGVSISAVQKESTPHADFSGWATLIAREAPGSTSGKKLRMKGASQLWLTSFLWHLLSYNLQDHILDAFASSLTQPPTHNHTAVLLPPLDLQSPNLAALSLPISALLY